MITGAYHAAAAGTAACCHLHEPVQRLSAETILHSGGETPIEDQADVRIADGGGIPLSTRSSERRLPSDSGEDGSEPFIDF